MKAIRITVNEALLREIDQSPEARKRGTIAQRYATEYAQEGSLGSEFSGWEEQGEWPAE